MPDDVRTHPVQFGQSRVHPSKPAQIPEVVALRAYEVYCKIFTPQPAMVDLEERGCRGGFSIGEIVAFLYARSFPKEEWETRFEEAQRGMTLR